MADLGLVHIYTGEGKGKTTSAVGLSVRALGHNLKVVYSFFHKRPDKYGYAEIANLEKLGAQIFAFAKGHPDLDSSVTQAGVTSETQNGLEFLKEYVHREHVDLLVMDEILISVRDNYISEKDLINFIKTKPSKMELVLTGRGATPRIIEVSDYVSYLTKMKHPYDMGIVSREGIEY